MKADLKHKKKVKKQQEHEGPDLSPVKIDKIRQIGKTEKVEEITTMSAKQIKIHINRLHKKNFQYHSQLHLAMKEPSAQ